MQIQNFVAARNQESVLATNRVLRNTYFLLSLTIIFSAFTAYYSMASNARYPGLIISLVGMFGLLFLTQALRNSGWGLVSIFAFTGFMGYILGPTLNFYMHTFSNGGTLILTALGGTAVIFLTLSAYTLLTRKNFSYMGGLLSVGIVIAFVASLAGLFFNMPLFQLFVSGMFMLICSGLIMYYTSMIIYGGETNYIIATISIYVALLNIFMSLLNILGAFGGNRN